MAQLVMVCKIVYKIEFSLFLKLSTGDFGAPLSLAVDGKDILIGVGSLRYFDGCQLGAPAVFTRITSYLDWIDENTKNEPEDEIYCNCDCNCYTCPEPTDRKTEL